MSTTAIPQTDWTQLLTRLEERNGAIELTPINPRPAVEATVVSTGPAAFESHTQPIWRARLLRIDEDTLVVEKPWSPNQAESIHLNEPLSGLIVDGPARWMFRTQATENLHVELNASKRTAGLRLNWPVEVRSAQRRNFFRVDTSAAAIPRFRAWQLLDTASTLEAQQANRTLHKGLAAPADRFPAEPQLGLNFHANMLDISGGGLRMLASPTAQSILEKWPMLWLRLELPPIPHPLLVAAKIAHWRLEPPHRIIAGLSFHFDHEPPHAKFVTEVTCKFAAHLQRLQLQRKK